MNATLSCPGIERPWLTYAKAVIFILPAVMAWAFACIKLLPSAKSVCEAAAVSPSRLGWIWPATFFLAEWGRTLLVAVVVALVLVELVTPRWWRRRLVVGIGIWVANVAVLFALSMLLVILLVAAPGLAHTQ